MVQKCKAIAEATWFQTFVTLVILFAGVLVGIETYPAAVERWGDVLHALDKVVLTIFILEIVIKMVAEGSKPWRYFYDPWNVFDFVIVAAALLPFAAQYATVLRLLRLLRVLRLVRALPKLQLLVGALLKSIPSMAYVSVLLSMLFYVYACASVFLWGANDPVHFGSLQISFVSLFRAVTLEDWTDLMYIQMYGCDQYGYSGMEHMCTEPSASPVVGALFFVSFVLFGTMIILNLFIGVILGGMDEAQRESEEAAGEIERLKEGKVPTMDQELKALTAAMADLQERIDRVRRAAKRDERVSRHLISLAPEGME